ncbi:MAG TPA: glycosyltransferase family 2 protein [Solirubrobacteraceae bacterium]|nr:glycosyltransferase family 2 protein [Solirubrobacteraceae bacterium]
MPVVTVAIPIFNGGPALERVLGAISRQRLEGSDGGEIELLVCDSGSTDGSREAARAAGARVLDVPAGEFVHGPVRNLLMEHARGDFVAFLTQDAEPVDDRWLARLLEGFELAPDVALVYGPYLPRPGTGPRAARDLERFFGQLSPDGQPRVDRLEVGERDRPAAELFGRRTYFTDANGCVRRAAWERVPFPPAAYAEDHALALAMLRAGYAKVYLPDAGVVHSHEYTIAQEFRRAFDDWRGLLEVYGWREPAGVVHWILQLRGRLGTEWRALRAAGTPLARRPPALTRAVIEHTARLAGAVLGSRADRLPARVRGWASLDGRSSFAPLGGEGGGDVGGLARPVTREAGDAGPPGRGEGDRR